MGRKHKDRPKNKYPVTGYNVAVMEKYDLETYWKMQSFKFKGLK